MKKDLYKYAKGFDVNPQNINRNGQPRKLVSSVIKQLEQEGIERVPATQVKALFESFLNCTESDLKKIADDKDQPILNRIVAKEMIGKKGFEIVCEILDRVHGKAQQTVNTKNDTEQDPILWFDNDKKE